MNNARDVAQNCQEDVDEEVGIATTLEEDTKRWEDDGEDDLADIAISPKGQPCSSPFTFFPLPAWAPETQLRTGPGRSDGESRMKHWMQYNNLPSSEGHGGL